MANDSLALNDSRYNESKQADQNGSAVDPAAVAKRNDAQSNGIFPAERTHTSLKGRWKNKMMEQHQVIVNEIGRDAKHNPNLPEQSSCPDCCDCESSHARYATSFFNSGRNETTPQREGEREREREREREDAMTGRQMNQTKLKRSVRAKSTRNKKAFVIPVRGVFDLGQVRKSARDS